MYTQYNPDELDWVEWFYVVLIVGDFLLTSARMPTGRNIKYSSPGHWIVIKELCSTASLTFSEVQNQNQNSSILDISCSLVH